MHFLNLIENSSSTEFETGLRDLLCNNKVLSSLLSRQLIKHDNPKNLISKKINICRHQPVIK